VTKRLAAMFPRGYALRKAVSFTVDHVKMVAEAGAHAILVGESIVKSPDVGAQVRALSGSGAYEIHVYLTPCPPLRLQRGGTGSGGLNHLPRDLRPLSPERASLFQPDASASGAKTSGETLQ